MNEICVNYFLHDLFANKIHWFSMIVRIVILSMCFLSKSSEQTLRRERTRYYNCLDVIVFFSVLWPIILKQNIYKFCAYYIHKRFSDCLLCFLDEVDIVEKNSFLPSILVVLEWMELKMITISSFCAFNCWCFSK